MFTYRFFMVRKVSIPNDGGGGCMFPVYALLALGGLTSNNCQVCVVPADLSGQSHAWPLSGLSSLRFLNHLKAWQSPHTRRVLLVVAGNDFRWPQEARQHLQKAIQECISLM
jgi:hypothetical protein